MPTHVIVGAGPVGHATARLLAERGEQVTIVSRSGRGPEHPAVTRIQCDATDAAALTAIAQGASALYNCAAPEYRHWVRDWPPLAAALLDAAEKSGAVLVTAGNLYGYGRPDSSLTELSPLAPTGPKGAVRKQMWDDALGRHEAGRVRVTEVRASDYVGRGAQSHLGDRVVPRLLAGKKVQVLPSADALHSWTFVDDVARLLVTVAVDERAWGHAWHVPTNPPRSQRQAVQDLAAVAGVAVPAISEVPGLLLKVMALISPEVRELPEIAYQLAQPFVIDSSSAATTFGLRPTPWADVLAATVEHYRSIDRVRARA